MPKQATLERKSGYRFGHSGSILFLLTCFQFITSAQVWYRPDKGLQFGILVYFLALIAVEWLYYILTRIFGRKNFELEILAFFLSGISLTILASVYPEDLLMQFSTLMAGLFTYTFLVWFLRDLKRAMTIRIPIAVVSITLFAVNLLVGTITNGAKNWLSLGPISIQPSELIKIAFVLVGATTLEKLQSTKQLTWFLGFFGLCIGALFVMRDFGTACIYFFVFIVLAFMRSGDLRTIILLCAGAALGVFMIVTFMPYVANRFSAWRHVWTYADTGGYQQTRVLIYAASGGLLGTGIGNGHLRGVFASTSDLAFGMLCEEWGVLFAILALASLAGIAIYAQRYSAKSRSAFYSIAACAAASFLLFQTCLHIFGITDILPLTGVTLPFVSRGGSSMISSWGLLAFIKAVDDRTYAHKKQL